MATTNIHYDFHGKAYTLRISGVDGDVVAAYVEVHVVNAMQPHVRRRWITGDKFYDLVRQYRTDTSWSERTR